MENIKIIEGGLSPEKSKERKKLINEFKNNFKTALTERGIINDFSLGVVVEKVINKGETNFEGHEMEIYKKIKDLLENPDTSPTSGVAAMPNPDRFKKAA